MTARPPVPVLTPNRRRWLYSVLMAVVPLLTFYGALSDQEAALWAGMVATVLGLTTAVAHVPSPEAVQEGHPPDGTGRHRATPEAPALGLGQA